jgi:hypothetical protein
MPSPTPASGSLTDILSGLQNGVVALNNLNKTLNAVATTYTSSGTTVVTIHLTHVSS